MDEVEMDEVERLQIQVAELEGCVDKLTLDVCDEKTRADELQALLTRADVVIELYRKHLVQVAQSEGVVSRTLVEATLQAGAQVLESIPDMNCVSGAVVLRELLLRAGQHVGATRWVHDHPIGVRVLLAWVDGILETHGMTFRDLGLDSRTEERLQL